MVFRVPMETENWCWPLWKMGKMSVAPPKTHPRAILLITNPPKLWVSGLPSVGHYGKWQKMAITPQKCALEQNFQLLTSLKFGSPVF